MTKHCLCIQRPQLHWIYSVHLLILLHHRCMYQTLIIVILWESFTDELTAASEGLAAAAMSVETPGVK